MGRLKRETGTIGETTSVSTPSAGSGGGSVASDFDTSKIGIDESFAGVPAGGSFTEEQWADWERMNAPPKKDRPLGSAMYGTSTGETVGQIGVPSLGPGVTPEDDPYMGWWGMDYPEAGASGRMTRYNTDSARFILMGMTTAELEALQRAFVQAGYIDEEARYAGRATLLPIFTALVQTADTNRVSWEMQIEGDTNAKAIWDAEHPDEDPGYGPFTAPDYMKPDYATLAQKAKASTEYFLGRKPTSGEMSILTEFMGGAERKAWEANVYAPALSTWEKNTRAYETGEDQESATLQQYDPDARFGEFFDDRYAGELAHRDRVDTVRENSPNLFGSIDTISRMMG
jgi:hypothetical protein